MQYQSDWFQLYRRAVLEADPFRVNDRVDAASRCIQERLADQKIEPVERTEMERCQRYLSLLRVAEYKLVS